MQSGLRSGLVSGLLLAFVASTHAIAATGGMISNEILPSVIALNQKPKDDTVSITYAYTPKDGRLVLFSGDPDAKGSAKEVGSVDLKAGDHRDVKVKLSTAAKSGEQLWAAIEQPKSDTPMVSGDERAEQSFVME
jgi:hypothetical protein